jgi:hypothetical protein
VRLGVNYPWRDYGWDFGDAPSGWRGSRATPRWYDDIDGHLRRLQGLGVTVVRWFVLGDGLSYGNAAAAPRLDAGAWTFDPPPLSSAFVEHFSELLDRFAAVNAASAGATLQLLPVLVDFHFCLPGSMPVSRLAADGTAVPDPNWVKGGRAEALTDASRRGRFIDEALRPLLRASQAHAESIYAWELINEPDWITSGWHPHRRRGPVSEEAMRDFLERGKDAIRRAGFKPTIGFNSLRTLQRSGVTADINQFHHYPGGRARLEPHTFDPRFPGIIGEFATARDDEWPELRGTGQSVLGRLRVARTQGYPLVLPWAYLQRDRHGAWSPEVERDIRTFAGE